VVPDHEGPLLEFLDCYTYDERLGAVFNQKRFDESIRNLWRRARVEKLKELDTLYIIALERNDVQTIADVVQRKMELREITKREIPSYDPLNGTLREYMLKTKNTLPDILN
jgi:hypothetical protein